MTNEGLLVTEQKQEKKYRVNVIGDLIITNAGGLQRRIDKALDEGFTEITIDLSGIEYIDSFGIGVIVKTKSDTDRVKGRLRVVVNATLHYLFEKCHLDDYIDLELEEKTEESPEKNP